MIVRRFAVPAPGGGLARGDRAAQEVASAGESIRRSRFHPSTRRIIMQDNELPPIEGELTDEELKQVAGGSVPDGNGTIPPPGQNSQGDDNSQGNEDQGNPPLPRKF
jgi:hypothetical protein